MSWRAKPSLLACPPRPSSPAFEHVATLPVAHANATPDPLVETIEQFQLSSQPKVPAAVVPGLVVQVFHRLVEFVPRRLGISRRRVFPAPAPSWAAGWTPPALVRGLCTQMY